MKTITHYISKGQFLGKMKEFKTNGLPTDSIIHKEIPGCGATRLELEFPRNSIIIEPNLPVILGKSKKMNRNVRKNKPVLAVYDTVTMDDIKKYVDQPNDRKKILTTPEGFAKVVDALGDAALDNYFLLFDECEKAIQDVEYRKRIIDPLELFFSFKNKAFVSATPIVPTDPRFKDFTHVYIKPDYTYKHEITVTTTNNIIFQLQKIFESYNKHAKKTDRKFFVFFKSSSRIKNIVNNLGLKNYRVYCSETKAKELKKDNLTNVYDRLSNNFSDYNFFTSRFFSAVDFDYREYKCDPIIIMISDPLAVEHSIIDPKTEGIQIIGRFRAPEKEDKVEKEVVKDIYHISNYNSKLSSHNQNEINLILEDIRGLHTLIRSFIPKGNRDYFNSLKQDIFKVKQFNYFHQNGEPNYFMIDNFSDTERVKGLYKSSTALLNFYNGMERFEVLKNSGYKRYEMTDTDLRETTKKSAVSKVNALVSLRLKEIMESQASEEHRDFILNMLRLTYKDQMSVVDKFTLKEAAKFDYDLEKIEHHKRETQINDDIELLKAYVRANYCITGHTTQEFEKLLSEGMAQTGVKGYKPKISTLKLFAELSTRTSVKRDESEGWLKGYRILKFY